MPEKIHLCVGKRKDAVARVKMVPGSGKILINKREVDDYFHRPVWRTNVRRPMQITERAEAYDVEANVYGGGLTGQAGAVRLGISRALMEFEPELRTTLKRAGFIRRDDRVVERKKPGKRGARRSFQFSKR